MDLSLELIFFFQPGGVFRGTHSGRSNKAAVSEDEEEGVCEIEREATKHKQKFLL